jgi:hypothetical protein
VIETPLVSMTGFKAPLIGAEMEQDVFTTNTVVEAPIPAFVQPERARKCAAKYAR